jgi:hypothetical protein
MMHVAPAEQKSTDITCDPAQAMVIEYGIHVGMQESCRSIAGGNCLQFQLIGASRLSVPEALN